MFRASIGLGIGLAAPRARARPSVGNAGSRAPPAPSAASELARSPGLSLRVSAAVAQGLDQALPLRTSGTDSAHRGRAGGRPCCCYSSRGVRRRDRDHQRWQAGGCRAGRRLLRGIHHRQLHLRLAINRHARVSDLVGAEAIAWRSALPQAGHDDRCTGSRGLAALSFTVILDYIDPILALVSCALVAPLPCRPPRYGVLELLEAAPRVDDRREDRRGDHGGRPAIRLGQSVVRSASSAAGSTSRRRSSSGRAPERRRRGQRAPRDHRGSALHGPRPAGDDRDHRRPGAARLAYCRPRRERLEGELLAHDVKYIRN